MKKLFKGIMKFRREEYVSHRELFQTLGRRQKPHTLFIGCSDSRVVPNLITRTRPGELFTVRNVANLVPPFRDTSDYVATTSAIEYSVLALGVETIVICGHSNCGGCSALHLPEEDLAGLPHVKKWLEISREVPERVARLAVEHTDSEREWLTERVNVLVQMRNLLSYPFIAERVEQDRLEILGWHYIIETGEIYNFNDQLGVFELVGEADLP